MPASLPRVTSEHSARLLATIDRMPGLGELLLTGDPTEVLTRVAETSSFLAGTLVPHLEAAERAVYPELERMFQNRHSMAPMKREHAEIRRLVEAFAVLDRAASAAPLTVGRRLAIRRVLFQLYALLKIHLAEEDAYQRILEHGVTDEAAEVLAAALEHPVAAGA